MMTAVRWLLLVSNCIHNASMFYMASVVSRGFDLGRTTTCGDCASCKAIYTDPAARGLITASNSAWVNDGITKTLISLNFVE